MKISAWHKANGDEVYLNMPLFAQEKVYVSQLFEWSKFNGLIHSIGGPGIENTKSLPRHMEAMKPDPYLFNLDYSLGYTFRYCPRKCSFCKVSEIEKDRQHYSIWNFHYSKFKKICLLNNNTFADPRWRETFEEIWDANLTVIDENGYDLRLLDEEKTEALKKTKFQGTLHFAWDNIKDETKIKHGLNLLKQYKLNNPNTVVYVLIGYDTSEEEDIHRCQIIADYNMSVYPMPYVFNNYTKKFKRFMNLFYWRKMPSIKEAWEKYQGGV